MPTLHPTAYALPLIGWREDVCLRELASSVLIAKIDTGARTAALHADNIVVRGKRVLFDLNNMRHELALYGLKRVKSSNGISELRPIIETVVEVGAHRFLAEITLTDRTDMEVPMLLGRETIKGRFLVNPARSFIVSRHKKKSK